MRSVYLLFIAVIMLVLFLSSCNRTTQVESYEEFDPNNFSRPTMIENEWFPLKPGMQLIYEGTVDEDGEIIPHRLITTVTDMTKVIGGVRNVVVLERDYSEDELVEIEIALFAQDDDGTVWHFGQYPEAYEEGKLVETPAWIHGIENARAGISMQAEPKTGTPSYAQGWGPAVSWTDRGVVVLTGQQNCVPFDCFEDVIVIEESSQEEPDAFQIKYYARGTGNIRVGWRGEDATQEMLELVEIVQLDSKAMAEVRSLVLELEKRAYELSKDVYGLTSPAE